LTINSGLLDKKLQNYKYIYIYIFFFWPVGLYYSMLEWAYSSTNTESW
jgi:hypothetical protein